MGQRLVVDIIQNDKIIAAIYYHWSAYFASTVYELARLSKTILQAEKEKKDKLFAIVQMLEEEEKYTGIYGSTEIRYGGVEGTPEEREAAKKMFKNYIPKEGVNRNCGLIAFTEKGIENLHSWEEGHADIYLDDLEIINDVDLDPHPFEITKFGKVKINGNISETSPFECTCESIIRLAEFMDKEYKIFYDEEKRYANKRGTR